MTPNPPPNLNPLINALNNAAASLGNNLTQLNNHFGNFLPTFQNFVTNYLNNPPNPNPNPNPPNNPKPKKPEKSVIEKLSQQLEGFFNKARSEYVNTFKMIDQLQDKALAQNITLKELNLPDTAIRMSELAREVLALREEGIADLSKNTLNLIGTMKKTGQSTASLATFLTRTSLALGMNQKESEILVSKLDQTSKAYQLSQQKMFEIANTMSTALKESNITGGAKQLEGVFSTLVAKMGARFAEPMKQVAQFLTQTGNENYLAMAGVLDDMNAFFSKSQEDQSKMLPEIINKVVRSLQSSMPSMGSTNEITARLMRKYQADIRGGVDPMQAFQQIAIGLQNLKQGVTTNVQDMVTLKSIEERSADALERSALKLEQILNNLKPSTASGIGKTMGVMKEVGAVAGTVTAGMALAKIFAKTGAGAGTGSIVPGLGTLAGAGIGLLTAAPEIYDLYLMMTENTAEIPKKQEETNELLREQNNTVSQDTMRSQSLLDVLNSMVMTFQPDNNFYDRESLRLQSELVDKMSNMNTNLLSVMNQSLPTENAYTR